MFTYGLRMQAITELRSNTRVVDANGHELNSTTLLVPREHDKPRGGTLPHNVIVVFNTVLVPGQHYKLRIASNANKILYDIINREKNYTDWIVFTSANIDTIDRMTFIAYISAYINVQLTDAVTWRPPSVTWKSGSQLDPMVVNSLAKVADTRFQAIGWRTEGLAKGVATGFTVHNLQNRH
jgi:hypothetical protein